MPCTSVPMSKLSFQIGMQWSKCIFELRFIIPFVSGRSDFEPSPLLDVASYVSTQMSEQEMLLTVRRGSVLEGPMKCAKDAYFLPQNY